MGTPRRWALGLLALAACGGCQATDYGQPCPALLAGAAAINPSAEPTVVSTREVVGQDPNFPCESLTCVASEGVGGYCSGRCGDGVGCPQGFTCRAVQASGSFAGERFCTWKHCAQASDCGPAHAFCCQVVAGADLPDVTRLCAYAHGGRCP